MAGWVGAASDLLSPLVDAIQKHVLAGRKLHADDTPMPVLAPGNGKTKTGRLWTYVRDERPAGEQTAPAVWFAYSEDRRGEHPRQHLKNFTGALQADAYAGFHHLYGNHIYEAACWAHARRKFHDIHLAHASPTTTEALARIGALYAIEDEIRGKPVDLRLSVRQTRARPLLDDLRKWMEKALRSLSSKSETAAAIRYALSRWRSLTRYTEDGLLEVDNSAAERALRAVALGRNYVQFPIMRSVLGRGRWMGGPIGAVSVQGKRTSHNRWSPDVGISDARRSSWKMEQQFTRRCAHGWSAAFFNPISQSSARVFSAAVTTHRPSTATYTALRILRIGPADTGWRWSRWTSGQLPALSLSTYRIVIAHIP